MYHFVSNVAYERGAGRRGGGAGGEAGMYCFVIINQHNCSSGSPLSAGLSDDHHLHTALAASSLLSVVKE